MAKITQLPRSTAVTDSDIAVIVQDGETRQIPRTLLAPPPPDDIAIDGNTLHLTKDGAPIGTGAEFPTITVDTEISETSENPVQNKTVAAAIQELGTGVNKAFQDQADVVGKIIAKTPTDLKMENNNLHLMAGQTEIGNGVSLPTIPTNLKLINNLLQLYAGENPIGAGVEIRKTPTLLDTFTIADGGDPVEFYQLSLTNQNWRKILISGTIQSTDTDATNRKLVIGTSSGFVYLNFQNTFNRKKYFTIDAECLANSSLRAHCTLSLYQYTDSNGGTYENVGRTTTVHTERISAVYMRILESQFAPGTSFEVWGVE